MFYLGKALLFLLTHTHAEDSLLASLPPFRQLLWRWTEAPEGAELFPAAVSQTPNFISDQSWGVKLLKPLLLHSHDSRSSQNYQCLTSSLSECLSVYWVPQAQCGVELFVNPTFNVSPSLPSKKGKPRKEAVSHSSFLFLLLPSISLSLSFYILWLRSI